MKLLFLNRFLTSELLVTQSLNEQSANSYFRYISNIEMPGGKIRYVPLHPPKDGTTTTSSASNWTIDFEELENAINEKTRMIVCPYTPLASAVPNVFVCRFSTRRKL